MIHSRILIREVGWKDVKETPDYILSVIRSNYNDILVSFNLLSTEWSIEEESKTI